jgi:hypothetical protein
MRVLLPQFLEQNGMSAFDLDYDQRKREFEPAYLGVAESLKVGLCTEISRLESFGKYEGADKAQLVKSLPGALSLHDRRARTTAPRADVDGGPMGGVCSHRFWTATCSPPAKANTGSRVRSLHRCKMRSSAPGWSETRSDCACSWAAAA